MNQILNVINQVTAYSDESGATDNPRQRIFDYTRKIQQIAVEKAASNSYILAPGASMTLFDGTKPTGLVDSSSVLRVKVLQSQNSIYALEVTSGPSSFRTARTPSGITACTVTINNSSLAVFDFTGATLSGVQVGDTMRISGDVLYDTGPYAFGALNAGLWVVIGISGTKVSAVRPTGESFSGANETVATIASGQVQFYSGDGVQAGDRFVLGSPFSLASQRTYRVLDVTPTTLVFVSTSPIPEEDTLTYVTGSVVVYQASKRLIHIEVDQDATVRLNGDTGSSNLISPIDPGSKLLPGWFQKWGDTWKCEVVNRSVNQLKLTVFTGE